MHKVCTFSRSPLPAPYPKIKEKDLPHCSQPNCTGLLRPYVVWYGEPLLKESIQKAGIYVMFIV